MDLLRRKVCINVEYLKTSIFWQKTFSISDIVTRHNLQLGVKNFLFLFKFWFVRLLALRPILAYCASLGW
jgi:hypothetical protein